MSSHAGPDPGLPLQHPRHAGHLRQSNGPVDQFQHQAGTDPTHDPAFADPNAPRKRSKVSRACDECRRKKVSVPAPSREMALTEVLGHADPMRCHVRVGPRAVLELQEGGHSMPVQPGADEEGTKQRVGLIVCAADRKPFMD